jgi:hypothetical protein
VSEPEVANQPFDRLTLLCAQMTSVLDGEENDDVRAIVFLDDGKRGGIQMHGYDNMNDGLVDLFMHIKVMFRSQGRDIEFVAVPDSPEGL